MLKNLFKTSFRSLFKNKLYSVINISGLAIGMASALLILFYVTFELNYDTYQPDNDRVYRVSLEIFQNGDFVFHSAENYPPVGQTMVRDYPEVIEWAHLYNMGSKNNVVITYEDSPGEPIKFKHKKFLYASPSTLSFFGVQMIDGNAETALTEPFTMAISESTAMKYFGNENPIGKYLRLKDDDFNDENCQVTAVYKDLPANTHLKFDVLISTPTLYNRFDGANDRYNTGWRRKDFYTYIKLTEGADAEALQAKLPEMVDRYMPGLADRGAVNKMYLQPLRDIHLTSKLSDESEINGDKSSITFLLFIAFFIILIAWVNYVNLATSRSLDRAREVGIRKVLGSLRLQLISQFLFESFLVNFLAVVLTAGIIAITLPAFYQVSGIPTEVKIWDQSIIWMSLGGFFLLGSLLSGLYPAFVLSSFRPVQTLKGEFRTGKQGALLRKVLVVLQFGASAALIIGTFTVYRQMNYVKSMDKGFDTDQVIVVERAAIADTADGGRNRQIETFVAELSKVAAIKSATSSGIVPGKKIRFKADVRSYRQNQGETFSLNFVGGDYGLVETLGMEIIAGRDFSRDFPIDRGESVLLTRGAAQLMGFDNPEDIINQPVIAETFRDTATVVGVVEDYNHESLKVKAIPSVFTLQPTWAEYFLIKTATSDVQTAVAAVEAQWEETYPGNPIDYFFLDEYFNAQYRAEEQFQSLFSVFSVLAIFIGCLGLFGLASFTVMKKTKEVGIRKVLGASRQGLFTLMSKEFLILILVANLIAWPLIYLVMNNWLQGFEYQVAISIGDFAIATIIVLVVALATVSVQIINSTKINPVKALRHE